MKDSVLNPAEHKLRWMKKTGNDILPHFGCRVFKMEWLPLIVELSSDQGKFKISQDRFLQHPVFSIGFYKKVWKAALSLNWQPPIVSFGIPNIR